MSIKTHYSLLFYQEHIEKTRETIAILTPEYLSSFDKVMESKKEHQCNMFIMKKELVAEYCNWLFPIITTMREKIDYKEYTAFHKRFPGRISERLLDVWLDRNSITYTELDLYYPEGSRIIVRVLNLIEAVLTKKIK